MVGARSTTRFAVLLTAPAVAVCAVVTLEVAFGFEPGVLLVTSKTTVQLPLIGMVIPVKLKAVAPPANVAGAVPTQVPVTLPPDALILTRVSVNEALVSGVALVLANVKVTVEVPPD